MDLLIKKKRGRKPKNSYEQIPEINVVGPKKRGRKKKYEIENFERINNRNEVNNFNHSIVYSDDEPECVEENQVKNVSFGNLNITVSKKVNTNIEENYRDKIINKFNEININEYSDEDIDVPIESIINNEACYYEKPKYTTATSVKENSCKRIKVITTLKNQVKEDNWPQQVDSCCWWCCHTFQNSPCTLPMKYDSLRKRYTFIGLFCSWNCTKAYNFDKTDHKMGERSSLITLLVKQMYSMYDAICIKPAPHRQCLKMFGGYMDIEQFRNGFSNVDSYHMNLIKYNYIYPEITEVTNVLHRDNKNNKLRLSRNN
uniref:MYM-type domain-containing protein n=1 Tax=viral metagenome TaxID=1070528 RepID=A0A6C0I906_9ZZZZ